MPAVHALRLLTVESLNDALSITYNSRPCALPKVAPFSEVIPCVSRVQRSESLNIRRAGEKIGSLTGMSEQHARPPICAHAPAGVRWM